MRKKHPLVRSLLESVCKEPVNMDAESQKKYLADWKPFDEKYKHMFNDPETRRQDQESSLRSQSGMSSEELAKLKKFDELEGTTKAYNEIITSLRSWNFNKKGMFLYGNVGIGKTSMLEALKVELVWKDRFAAKKIRTWECSYVMDQLKKFENGRADHFRTMLYSVDLLIIDDFGANMGTEFEVNCILQLLNQRIKTDKPIFMTSNLDPHQVKARFGDRILDRILEVMLVVKVPGNESHRRKIQANERAKANLHK